MKSWKSLVETAMEALRSDTVCCATCAHYLEGGCCAAGHELECMDEGYEAWKAKDAPERAHTADEEQK